MTPVPRHVVCVLGNWRSLDVVEAIVQRVAGSDFDLDREYSQLTSDERMTASFEASYDRVTPSMEDEDWQAVQDHSSVAYILSPPLLKDEAIRISGRMLMLTSALLEEDGVAAKSESAGLAHGRTQWLQYCREYRTAVEEADEHRQAATLFWSWVRRPLLSDEEDVFYSCGMHLLGERDIEVSSSVEVSDAVKWIDLLGLYLVADKPQRPLLEGEGFRLQNDRRIMQFHDCLRYDGDRFFFNPYGYIRLVN